MKFVLVFLFLFSSQIKSQIQDLDSMDENYLKRYDIIFIGEQHKIFATDVIEAKLVSVFNGKNIRVLLEAGYDINYPLFNFFVNNDSINYNFFSLVENKYNYNLVRFLYNNHIFPKAIDIFAKENFSKDYIIKAYQNKELPILIQNDLKEFLEIGMMKPPRILKNLNKYEIFLEHYNKNKALHKKCLDSDSTGVDEYFYALRATIDDIIDPNVKGIGFSDYRETFLFNMVKNEIEKDSNKTVISINGNAHINLDDKAQLRWVKNTTWSPLAYKIKKIFLNKNICSIYLLNIKKDSYFKKDYPNEMKYIIKNTEPNKSYIINLDYKDTPLKNLIGKYTHIVVY